MHQSSLKVISLTWFYTFMNNFGIYLTRVGNYGDFSIMNNFLD